MKNKVLSMTAFSIAIIVLGILILVAVKSTLFNEAHLNPITEQPNSQDMLDQTDTLRDTQSTDLVFDSNTEYEFKSEASNVYNSGQIFNDWDELPYDNMCFADEDTFEFLKAAFNKVDYCGEFNIGNPDAYHFYLEKYYRLMRNEVAFIDIESRKEVFLNEFETLEGYIDDNENAAHHLKNKIFYFFDMDEDGTPELCISSEYIFKYIPDLDKYILWGGFKGNYYYSVIGSRKMTWDHGAAKEILHEFYQLDTNGNKECSVFFFLHNLYHKEQDQEESVYIATLPRYVNRDDRIEIPETIEHQGYSFYADYNKRDEIVYCFRVTEEQYKDLTKNYFAAKELALEKIKEVSFTYEELFGRFF